MSKKRTVGVDEPIVDDALKGACNDTARPTADELFNLMQFADMVAGVFFNPLDLSLITTAGITMAMVLAPAMPDEATFPGQVIEDRNGVGDSRSECTTRKLLALLRVVAQLKGLADATQYGVPQYARMVAAALAVNKRK